MADESGIQIVEKCEGSNQGIDEQQWFTPHVDISIDRLVPNGEPGTLVWLDPTLKDTGLKRKIYTELRAVNNYVLFYTNTSTCVDYLISRRKQWGYLILIVSNIRIHDVRHALDLVDGVLLIEPDEKHNELLQKSYSHPKITGMFENQNAMLTALKSTVADIERHMFQHLDNNGLRTFDRQGKALRNLSTEIGPFLWCHVFKTLVMIMPNSPDAFKQMLAYCRSSYQDNACQLAQIDEFERTYRSSNAFYWYTRPTFVYRLVNRALRTEDMVALYTFRYFISDLCRSLEANHATQISSTKLYRGTIMNRNEIERYRVGNLVSTNGFLSSSRKLSVAQSFISWDQQTQSTPSQSQLDSQQYVLFEIDIEPSLVDSTLLADISGYSAFPEEYEVLFNLGTTFEITSMHYKTEHHLWSIRLRLAAETLAISRSYERYILERVAETNVDILYGILLADMGEYNQSLCYFERLLEILPEVHEERANAFYCLARAYRFLGEYEKALGFFLRAQDMQEKILPSSSFDLARTLAGIASTYYEMQNYQQELLYYEASLRMYRGVLPDDHIEIARSLNRLGFALINQKFYDKALDYLNQSVAIYQKIVHETHPGIAQPLHNLGLIKDVLGFPEQALDFFQRAMRIRERALPSDHPQLADSCYCLSLLYEKQGQYDLAFGLAQRALEIRETKLIGNNNNRLMHDIKIAAARMKRLSTSSTNHLDPTMNNAGS